MVRTTVVVRTGDSLMRKKKKNNKLRSQKMKMPRIRVKYRISNLYFSDDRF